MCVPPPSIAPISPVNLPISRPMMTLVARLRVKDKKERGVEQTPPRKYEGSVKDEANDESNISQHPQ